MKEQRKISTAEPVIIICANIKLAFINPDQTGPGEKGTRLFEKQDE
jgi:hypothetical protein